MVVRRCNRLYLVLEKVKASVKLLIVRTLIEGISLSLSIRLNLTDLLFLNCPLLAVCWLWVANIDSSLTEICKASRTLIARDERFKSTVIWWRTFITRWLYYLIVLPSALGIIFFYNDRTCTANIVCLFKLLLFCHCIFLRQAVVFIVYGSLHSEFVVWQLSTRSWGQRMITCLGRLQHY